MSVIPPEGHEPGIYFGMSDEEYHGDPAIGSSNLRMLKQSPADFHWNWVGNPERIFEKETEALVFGRAVHKLVLEGETAFQKLFMLKPSGDGILTTAEDMKNWLAGRNLDTKGTKEVLAKRIHAFDPRVPIADLVIARAKEEGKTLLTAEQWHRIHIASAYITRNPHLAPSFTDGYPEVAIFWQRRGIRLKCKIDFLRLSGMGIGAVDLKSFRNSKGQPIEQAFDEAAGRYPIQGAHYLDGIRQIRNLYRDGLVYGDHDEEWLHKISRRKEMAFALILYKADGAPFASGRILQPQNELVKNGARDIEQALDVFETYYRHFGETGPWVSLDPPRELFAEDLPRYMLGR